MDRRTWTIKEAVREKHLVSGFVITSFQTWDHLKRSICLLTPVKHPLLFTMLMAGFKQLVLMPNSLHLHLKHCVGAMRLPTWKKEIGRHRAIKVNNNLQWQRWEYTNKIIKAITFQSIFKDAQNIICTLRQRRKKRALIKASAYAAAIHCYICSVKLIGSGKDSRLLYKHVKKLVFFFQDLFPPRNSLVQIIKFY